MGPVRFLMTITSLLKKLPTTSTAPFCPSDVRETIPVAPGSSTWSRFKRYFGVGFLIAVGYMDPGNWATDIQAGSHFGYALLWVVVLSCLIAMLLQTLCLRLGVVTGKDLAQLCRAHTSPRLNRLLWFFAQIAIIACDFAEVLGTALALKLLFGIPLATGTLLTALDTLIVLALQGKSELRIEYIVAGLVICIAGAFAIEIALSKPDVTQVLTGLRPDLSIFHTPEAMLVAVGILGATVMPHNLYLHSSAVMSRKLPPGNEAKQDAIRLLTWDIILTLALAMMVNAAILIVAASVFHASGHTNVTEIDEAYNLLTPLLGASFASIGFGIALLASGQSSTFTGTMAGQIILQGFLNLRIPCWQQRLFTRLSAVLPAWLLVVWYGDAMLGKLLVGSQVVLSLQLPFAVVPLVWFSGRKDIMGEWAINRAWQALCWFLCSAIIGCDLYLVYQTFAG